MNSTNPTKPFIAPTISGIPGIAVDEFDINSKHIKLSIQDYLSGNHNVSSISDIVCMFRSIAYGYDEPTFILDSIKKYSPRSYILYYLFYTFIEIWDDDTEVASKSPKFKVLFSDIFSKLREITEEGVIGHKEYKEDYFFYALIIQLYNSLTLNVQE